jgi:branched-chain amino acid transport system ATP-binding protein
LFLEAKDISVYYDTAQVLNKVSLNVDKKEVISVVGPNGAGKTTLLRTISGLVRWEKDASKGTKLGRITIEGGVIFDGERIDNLPAHEIAAKGLILCPERGRLYREMTVTENLKAHAFLCKDKNIIQQNMEKVYSLFPILKERGKQIAGTLSGGERSMLSIGRALMSQARLMLIDEPSTGLSPIVKDELFQRLKKIHGLGLTFLLVEQDVSYAFEMAQRNYVMSKGHIVSEGTAEELLSNEFLRKTYLGL